MAKGLANSRPVCQMVKDMRIIYFLSIFFCVLLLASKANSGGFIGPGIQPAVTRAADALTAWDDAPCILEGHILEKIPYRKDRYLFGDESGKIVVEIDPEVFGPLTITPENRVRLVGHVDWSKKRPNEVEVDGISIID